MHFAQFVDMAKMKYTWKFTFARRDIDTSGCEASHLGRRLPRSLCWYQRRLGWNGWPRQCWVSRCNDVSVMSESRAVTYSIWRPPALNCVLLPPSLPDVDDVDSLEITRFPLLLIRHWIRTEKMRSPTQRHTVKTTISGHRLRDNYATSVVHKLHSCIFGNT